MLLNKEQAWEFSLLALCIWREGRGEPFRGQRGIGWAVKNRLAGNHWWGHDWEEVILKKSQFSSFNADDPNAKLLPGDPTQDVSWASALSAAEDVYSGAIADPTGGATHYCRFDLNPLPVWTQKATFTVQLGNHLFYKGVA